MSTSSTRRLFRRTVLLLLLAGTSSCIPPQVDIPLAVPLAAVAGSRPATPEGLQIIGEFGDGVLGQEQQRTEIRGLGFGVAMRDRIEFSVSGYGPTRTVQGQTSRGTIGLRGKIRLVDFSGGRRSFGIHIAHMTSQRTAFGVQDERLAAWDVALPLTFYPGDQFRDRRWGVYAAPRLVFQTFEDRLRQETTKGTLAAALVGLAGRWRFIAVTGELNFARTPRMSVGNRTFRGAWIVLPMASASLILPIGD